MNYIITLIIVLLFIAALIAKGLIVNSKQMKNNYKNIDDRKLIELNVRRDIGVRPLLRTIILLVKLTHKQEGVLYGSV
jgi:hypothetical protein